MKAEDEFHFSELIFILHPFAPILFERRSRDGRNYFS